MTQKWSRPCEMYATKRESLEYMDEWSTMAYHVYNLQYKKVLTIAMSDMQSKDIKVQVQCWRNLNIVMARHRVDQSNFKGFMANNTMAN